MLADQLDRAVVIAVTVVHVVQASIDDVVDMIAVRDRFMTAVRPMNVACAVVYRCATVRIGVADLDHVFVVMITVRVVQVAVVDVIDMTVMLDGGVSAVRSVYVIRMRMSV